jgi:hypothetical protein
MVGQSQKAKLKNKIKLKANGQVMQGKTRGGSTRLSKI